MSIVYEPAEDSYLLASTISEYAKNKSVLDMGSGSGILAETAKSAGASSVLAADINPQAIKMLKNKNIPCINSDLFKNIKSNFDLIICNPPYLPEDKREDKESKIATTGGKLGDEFIINFLKEAVNHMNKDGIILLLLSSLTPHKRIISSINKSKLKYKVVASKSLFFETLQVWEIHYSKI